MVSTVSSAACKFVKFASHNTSNSFISACKLKSGSGISVKSKEILIGLLHKQTYRCTLARIEKTSYNHHSRKSTAADLENVRVMLHITVSCTVPDNSY